MLAPWKESYDKPRQLIKKQRCDLATKQQQQRWLYFVDLSMDLELDISTSKD